MNPIHQWLVAHSTALHLLRRCDKCGNVEKVTRDWEQKTVTCPKCGAPLRSLKRP